MIPNAVSQLTFSSSPDLTITDARGIFQSTQFCHTKLYIIKYVQESSFPITSTPIQQKSYAQNQISVVRLFRSV